MPRILRAADAGRRLGWNFRGRRSDGFRIVSCGRHESRTQKTSPASELAKTPVIAQPEHGERGKCLGHRGDAEKRVGRDGALRFEILYAERADMQEPSIGDDPVHQARNVRVEAELLEDAIRRYPSQWLWMHRRWKTRPPGEPPIY